MDTATKLSYDDIALLTADSDAFATTIFHVACLYAFVVFLFGLLSLQTTSQQQRSAQWAQYYGSPETAFQLNKQQQIQKQKAINGQGNAEPTRLMQSFDFLYYFFIRPSVLIGAIFAVFVLRHYTNSLVSEILAFGFSAMILSSWSTYPTKFIPGMCAAIGFVYGTMHLIAADHLPSF